MGILLVKTKAALEFPALSIFPVIRAPFQAYVFLVYFAVVIASAEALLVALSLPLASLNSN